MERFIVTRTRVVTESAPVFAPNAEIARQLVEQGKVRNTFVAVEEEVIHVVDVSLQPDGRARRAGL